jgi:hypothetical protein
MTVATTVRERLLEVSSKFERIESAVFTSFNFNADFFEQNVLPTLFGVDVREGSRKAREQTVHKRLADTSVAVFYDPSVASTSTKAYRYAAHAVFLGGQRRFHPKCIFIAGTDADGTLWLYIAAMSANLGITGWGRNCEGFFDTWVHAKTEQPARAAIHFLGYLDAALERRPTKDRSLANLIERLAVLRGQRSRTDPEGGAWADKAGTQLYFSPLHRSMWSFVEEAYGGRIEEVLAASPYWGEGSAIKAALAGRRLQLVASLSAPAFKSTQLGDETLAQLGVDARDVLTWSNDQGRFFHIKLYRITIRGQEITGTGSCNFTSAGLQWGAPGSESGNVECMLFDRRDFIWPRTEKLRSSAIASQTDNTDAPPAWPVYVHVQYDWERRSFSWDVDGRKGSDEIDLQLPDGHGFFAVEKDQGSRKGELKSRVFRFRYRGEAYTAFVAEVNLAYSDRRYGALLSPGQILESWRSGAPAEPIRVDARRRCPCRQGEQAIRLVCVLPKPRPAA